MVAVDSVAALVPRAELEGEIGQLQGAGGCLAGWAGGVGVNRGSTWGPAHLPARYSRASHRPCAPAPRPTRTPTPAPACLPALPAVGAQARLMSGAMRKLAGNASKHNCTIIFINQLRQKVGVFQGSMLTRVLMPG